MKCEICGKEFAHLGLHINYQHKDITQKEYYDRYLKQGGEGFCFTCGQPLPFVNLIRGYKHYCNAKCELADKRIVEKAKQNKWDNMKTIVFVDEIHRFNKSQQDAFLPHVENIAFM